MDISIHDKPVRVVLDTGADMSVLPRDVLLQLLWRICLCYLDDIVIYGRTQAELLERINIVLLRLRDVGLKVKPSKCDLFKTEIQFLGHLVSNKGVQPLPHKVAAIKEWPTPHCLRDVRAFYGLASYYRKFVKSFATIAEPLTRLTKKGYKVRLDRRSSTSLR